MKTAIDRKFNFSTLINPFEVIAGGRALMFGALIITVTALFSFLFNTHHAGIIDIKYGQSEIGLASFLLYGLVNVVVISVLLFLSGALLSKSSIRFVDVVGTQALARFPMIVTPFLNIGNPMERLSQYLLKNFLGQGEDVAISFPEWVYIIFGFLVMVLVIVWAITLMYNAYSVSCNLRGTRALVSFIVVLVLAEIASLILNIVLVTKLS